MRSAIQCLEFELARKLDEVDELARALNQLRRLDVSPARDPRDGFPPTRHVVSTPAAGSASPVAGVAHPVVELVDGTNRTTPKVEGPGGAGHAAGDELDPAPPHGIERPDVVDADGLEHECDHCDRSFATRRGLSHHMTVAHLEHKRAS